MTPDTIRKATAALAKAVETRSDARANGAAFGRALAAQIRARAIATEQMNEAAVMDIELSLLQLAASSDERESSLKRQPDHAIVWTFAFPI